MKKLLVTGGAGFIGANFVHYWMKKHKLDKVVVLDALTYAGNIANLGSVKDELNFTFVQGNICNQALIEQVLVDHSIDTLVHFAAESHVDRSITDSDVFIETNIMGTYSLLKAVKKVWLDGENILEGHRFHHVSTDEVYGTLSPTDAPFTEDTAYAPNSPYSASKAASDHLVRSYHHTYRLNVTTSNCSNNYGPFHFPEKLIPHVILNAIHGRPLPIYGDGLQIRDWLYVEDHAKALLKVVIEGGIGETYNIGGHNEKTNLEVVQTICDLLEELAPKKPSEIDKYRDLITFVKDRPGHDARYAIDASKIERELGWVPEETFESGLRKTVQWYLGNTVWWERVLSGAYRMERIGADI